MVSSVNYAATLLSFKKHKNYCYGYDKITAIAATCQVALLLAFSYDTCTTAYSALENPVVIEPNGFAIFSLLIASALTFALVSYQQYVVDKTGHLIVYADRLHYTTDLITNASMLVYFAGIWFFGPESAKSYAKFDIFLVILLSVYISYCCLHVIQRAWAVLLDKRLDEHKEKELLKSLSKNIRGASFHMINSRCSGVREYFRIGIQLSDNETIKELNSVIESAQKYIGTETDSLRCEFVPITFPVEK